MKIEVSVKTGASCRQVRRIEQGKFAVSVKTAPVEGRANEAVIETLAEHFGIAKSRVLIRHGFKGKRKIVEIIE